MKKVLSVVLLLAMCVIPAFAQQAQVPSAPQPKHEAVKFILSSTAVAASSTYFVYAVHDGARTCQAEDNRAGVGDRFGTADVYGRKPKTLKTLIPGLALLGTGGILELTGHKKAAKAMLTYGAAVQFGIAGATQWAGCN